MSPPGARISRRLARCGARASRGDRRPRRITGGRPHPVHTARQEGPRALATRGTAARPQLHRYRAHPPRPDPRGRRRRRPGARRHGRRSDARVRQQVIQILSGYTPGRPAPVSPFGSSESSRGDPVVAPARAPRHCSFCRRDLSEVEHYATGTGAVICDECIVAAYTALEAATDEEQVLVVPPRVVGSPPLTDPPAVEQIVHAFAGLEPVPGFTAPRCSRFGSSPTTSPSFASRCLRVRRERSPVRRNREPHRPPLGGRTRHDHSALGQIGMRAPT